MKRFVVIGLDHFGYDIAIALSERRHEVLAIDEDDKKIEDIKDNVTRAIAVDLRDEKTLSKFVDSTTDAVIVSMGDDISSSVLTVSYLKTLGINNIIAKAANNNHGKILKLVGATDVILPEKDVAIGLAMKLTTKNLVEHIPLAEDYSIVEMAVPDNLVGKTLGELRLRDKYDIEVIAVKNVLLDKFHLIPKSDFKLSADSALIVIGKSSVTENLKLEK